MKLYHFAIAIIGILIPNLVQSHPKTTVPEVKTPTVVVSSALETKETKRSDKDNEPKKSDSITSDPKIMDAKELENAIMKEDSKIKQDEMMEETMEVDSQKCPGITCSNPPPDATCKISRSITTNPMLPLLGSKSDCCPVHVCVRADGTHFTHYGFQSEGTSGVSSSYAQGTGVNNFPNPPTLFQSFNVGRQQPYGQFPNPPLNNRQPFNFFNNVPQMPVGPFNPFFGTFNGNVNNNRVRNVVPMPMQSNQYSGWEFYNNNRERRDIIPQGQSFRSGPLEFMPQMQQGVFHN